MQTGIQRSAARRAFGVFAIRKIIAAPPAAWWTWQVVQRFPRGALRTALSVVTGILLTSTSGLAASAPEGRWQDVTIEQGQKVIAHRSDGRVETYSPKDFEGARTFVDLKVSPDRRYIGWQVTHSHVEESYPVPLDVVVIGPSTTLRLNNGMAVRT